MKLGWAFVFAIASALFVRAQDSRPPIFPSDGKPPAEANGAELLEAVCPGHVQVGKEIGCGKYCPEYTSFGAFGDNFDWSLVNVTFGHFLSASSEDSVLSMGGCEPHSENFGGTILLTREHQRWKMLWYKAGVDTQQCHKIGLPGGRGILVCMGASGAGPGFIIDTLYVEDLRNPSPSLMADGPRFLSMTDTMTTCGENTEDETKPLPLTRAEVQKVEFPTNMEISITFLYGTRAMTPADVQDCLNGLDHKHMFFVPETKTYRVTFNFDGHTFQPTPASAAILHSLGLR